MEHERSGEREREREVVGVHLSLLLVTHSFIGHCFRLMSTGSKESDGHGMRRCQWSWYEEVMVMYEEVMVMACGDDGHGMRR